MGDSARPEPWLRGTLTEIPAVGRAVLHALELAHEDLEKWCRGLNDRDLNARPGGIAPVAFHLRHIARSIDRLLTYAEGGGLNTKQLTAVETELGPEATSDALLAELTVALRDAARRIRVLAKADPDTKCNVGSRKLPTTLGGLLVHIADHTQRHVGQTITTVKVLVAQRSS